MADCNEYAEVDEDSSDEEEEEEHAVARPKVLHTLSCKESINLVCRGNALILSGSSNHRISIT